METTGGCPIALAGMALGQSTGWNITSAGGDLATVEPRCSAAGDTAVWLLGSRAGVPSGSHVHPQPSQGCAKRGDCHRGLVTGRTVVKWRQCGVCHLMGDLSIPQNGLFSPKKEWHFDACYSTDES